jgi:hypothetical protein
MLGGRFGLLIWLVGVPLVVAFAVRAVVLLLDDIARSDAWWHPVAGFGVIFVSAQLLVGIWILAAWLPRFVFFRRRRAAALDKTPE